MLEQIKSNFNRGYFGMAMPIAGLDEACPAWTLKDSEWIGVAVPMERYVPCNEEFANVELTSFDDYTVGNHRGPFLVLRSFAQASRNEFAVVCAQFIDPGRSGELRRELLGSPSGWWKRWRELLGNTSSDHKPYSVLGELMVTLELMRRGEHPRWSGAEYGTHDIMSNAGSMEVKSTLKRHGSEITVSSVHQLMPTGDDALRLAFLRFEETPDGVSVDDLVQELVAEGYKENLLEKNLSRLGYPKGRESRRRRYRPLEWNVYDIDDSFPAITPAAFAEGKLPTGIVRLIYTVDLAGLNAESWLADAQ